MQTRRDQVQAHRFAKARMQSALLAGDLDRAEPPLRRSGIAAFAAEMVAVMVAAGFGLYGLMKRGGKAGWRDFGVIVLQGASSI